MKKYSVIVSLAIIFLVGCKKEKTTPNPSTTSSNPTSTGCDPNLILNLEMNDSIKDNTCNLNLITNNGATFTTDRNANSSKALNFDGIGYLNYPNSSNLHPNYPFTISFWVNVNDSSDWAHNYFIQSNIRPNGGYCGYMVRGSGSGTIQITVGDTTTNTRLDATSSIVMPSNTWMHYTAVVVTNDSIAVYWNGVRDANASLTGSVTSVTYPASSSVSGLGIIGGVGFLTNNGRLQGKMDKVKIWKKALSAAEVSTLYNNLD